MIRRVEDGVEEVESDVEPQDDYNRLSDSDESVLLKMLPMRVKKLEI